MLICHTTLFRSRVADEPPPQFAPGGCLQWPCCDDTITFFCETFFLRPVTGCLLPNGWGGGGGWWWFFVWVFKEYQQILSQRRYPLCLTEVDASYGLFYFNFAEIYLASECALYALAAVSDPDIACLDCRHIIAAVTIRVVSERIVDDLPLFLNLSWLLRPLGYLRGGQISFGSASPIPLGFCCVRVFLI